MKTTYKRHIVVILLCGWVGIILTQQISYDLNTNLSGSDHTYIARDQVSLLPGFEYLPTNNTELDIAINPSLLFLPTEGIYGDPDGTINENGGIVGAIPGEFMVSPSGSAVYSIPIQVPQGINNLQPELSVVYNSMGGTSMMGWGWNLNGLSSIIRAGNTYYHNDKVLPIQLNAKDNYLLDGQYLVKIEDIGNPPTQQKYRTEIESYTDIVRYVTSDPYYIAETKEGLNLFYGNTEDSKLTGTIGYLLSKVTDKEGNYILYSYKSENSSEPNYSNTRINKIEYGGNTNQGTPCVYTLEFNYYTTSSNIQSGYVHGIKSEINYVLESISIKQNSELLYRYKFHYTHNLMRTRLIGVILETDDSRYNSTTIEWGQESDMRDQQVTHISPPDLCSDIANQFCYADFNGDGRTDFLAFDYDDKKLTLYLAGDSDNLFKASASIQLSLDNGTTLEEILPGDFNGDGYCDFVTIKKNKDNSYLHQLYIYNGSTIVEKASFTQSKKALTGDFDGDGKTELLTPADTKVLKFNGTSAFTTVGQGGITWGEVAHTTFFPNNRYTIDFDGDGKTEVLVLYTDGYKIYTLDQEKSTPAFIELMAGDYPNKDTGIYFGDYNGDGLTDMLTQRLHDNQTAWYLSKGNDLERIVLPDMQTYLTKLFTGDFNGDGKTDVAFVYPSSGSNVQLLIGYSNGLNFIIRQYPSVPNPDYMVVSDFNGDGKDDVLQNFYSQSCNTTLLSRMALHTFGKDDEELYVKSITDGLGKEIRINYESTTNPDVYTRDRNYPFPVSFLAGSLKVVSSYSMGADENWFNTTLNYYNARIHRQGKGFLGFQKLEATNVEQGIKTTTTYDYNSTYYYPYISSQQTATTSGKSISMASYTYSFINLGNKRILPYVTTEQSTDHLTGLSNRISTSNMDSGSGNPGTIVTTRGSHIETRTFTYIQKGSWCENKIASTTISASLSGDTYTRKTTYEYDNKGNLTTKTIDPGDENQLQEKYTYDAYGNCTQIQATANGKTRTSRMYYSSSGLFMTSARNELNQTTTYNWNQKLGVLESKQDYAGRVTSYRYNDFGHLKETIYPDGTREAQEQFWVSPGNAFGARYYIYKKASGQAPAIIWYDALGREVRNETYGLNNRKIFNTTEYNDKGQIYRVSEPTFEGDTEKWAATYSYDLYGRTSSVVTPMGTVTHTYNGLVTKVQAPDGEQETTLDNTGKIIKSKVNGKSVTYTYYASGLMKSSLPEAFRPHEMEYDLQGNRILLYDPDAGIIYSKYNGFGEVLWEKQQIHLGQEDILTSYTYLDNGLLQQVSQNGRNTVYTYDESYRLKQSSIPGEHTMFYTYDEYDRPVRISENIGGKVFSHEMEYTLLGQLKKETYPSGYTIRNHYDENGCLVSVTDNEDRLIWQPLEENAKGQLTRAKRGNQETIFGFDDKGFPVSIVAGNIINLDYKFDNKGNLSTRSNNLIGYSELFLYDNLNRLTEWTVYNNYTNYPNGIIYDSSGNIDYTSEFESRQWVYGNGTRDSHQLTSIEGAPLLMPKTNLQISYTDFKKVKSLIEEDRKYIINYGVDNERRSSVYSKGNTVLSTRYYVGDYEEEVDASGNTRKIHYLPGGAIYLEEGSTKSLLYGYHDYQGSLVAITNNTGRVLERYAYNPWGTRLSPDNWIDYDKRTSFLINRGYTMHEHLDEFGVINMNGRVYDPLTYSFFSPDPYIQAPDNWLNYNRYMYCYGNPLKYTDPSGEWFLIDGLIVGVAGFITGYLSHGITQGNWGGKAFAAGAGGAAMSWLSYNTIGGAAVMSGWGFAGQSALNTTLGFFTPSVGFSVGDFSLSFSPIAMFTGGVAKGAGFGFGAGVSASYQMGDWRLSGGIGFSGGINYYAYGLGYDDGNFGVSWHQTSYGGLLTNNNQSTATIGLRYKDWYIKHENDLGAMKGDGGDKYRTAAIELGWKNYMIGANVYTNDGKIKDPNDPKRYLQNEEYESRLFGKNSEGSYRKGQVYQSPFYIGMRYKNGVVRTGINTPVVQDLTQNFIHKLGNFPYYETPYGKYGSPYVQMGRMNPFTLYGF